MTVTFIVMDSKPSNFPDQTGNLTKLRGMLSKDSAFSSLSPHPPPRLVSTAINWATLRSFSATRASAGVFYSKLVKKQHHQDNYHYDDKTQVK